MQLPFTVTFRPANLELEEVYCADVYTTFRPFFRMLALLWGALVFFGGIFIIYLEKKFELADAVRLIAGASIMWFFHLRAWLGLRRIRRTPIPQAEYTITISDRGFLATDDCGQDMNYDWSELTAAGLAGGNLFLITQARKLHVIPRRALPSREITQELLTVIQLEIEKGQALAGTGT